MKIAHVIQIGAAESGAIWLRITCETPAVQTVQTAGLNRNTPLLVCREEGWSESSSRIGMGPNKHARGWGAYGDAPTTDCEPSAERVPISGELRSRLRIGKHSR